MAALVAEKYGDWGPTGEGGARADIRDLSTEIRDMMEKNLNGNGMKVTIHGDTAFVRDPQAAKKLITATQERTATVGHSENANQTIDQKSIESLVKEYGQAGGMGFGPAGDTAFSMNLTGHPDPQIVVDKFKAARVNVTLQNEGGSTWLYSSDETVRRAFSDHASNRKGKPEYRTVGEMAIAAQAAAAQAAAAPAAAAPAAAAPAAAAPAPAEAPAPAAPAAAAEVATEARVTPAVEARSAPAAQAPAAPAAAAPAAAAQAAAEAPAPAAPAPAAPAPAAPAAAAQAQAAPAPVDLAPTAPAAAAPAAAAPATAAPAPAAQAPADLVTSTKVAAAAPAHTPSHTPVDAHAPNVSLLEAGVLTGAAARFSGGMGGVGLAMSAQQWRAIKEKQELGMRVDEAEYLAAIVNTGSSTLDTVGKSLDGMASSSLGRLNPNLKHAGGPLVQAALAAPMIIAAARTGDTEQIGAATFGAIGGIGAGMAGQALIPIPGVGFVAGVVVGDGAAKVGGLATTAIFNDDPDRRERATTELKQIGVDYFASPGAVANLSGAAVSSVGRAVNILGEVAIWGGDILDNLAVSSQNKMSEQLQQHMPPIAAEVISNTTALPARIVAHTLKGAGTVVAAAGTAVDAVGKAAEDVGHHINKGVVDFQQTVSQEYQKNVGSQGVVRAAATATVAATVDVAQNAAGYVELRAKQGVAAVKQGVAAVSQGVAAVSQGVAAVSQGVAAVSNAAQQAQSWYASNAPSWLGGGEPKKAESRSASPAPAPPPAQKSESKYASAGSNEVFEPTPGNIPNVKAQKAGHALS